MQVVPIKPTLTAPGTKRLNLKCDEPRLNFAFNFNLRRYILAPSAEAHFSVIFRPAAVVSYDRSCKLVVDTSFPPREPHPGWPMTVGPATCCSPQYTMSS